MKKIYLIGDLHLDHFNILKYCNRPFKDVKEMNKVLVDNWNKTVKKNDIVFFLGDLSKKRNDYWLSKLNGNIIFIEGNHDTGNINFHTGIILKHYTKRFLLIHNPEEAKAWNGWVIHGHKHNNDLKNYPLINRRRKTINVSCELIDYKPIDINSLLRKL